MWTPPAIVSAQVSFNTAKEASTTVDLFLVRSSSIKLRQSDQVFDQDSEFGAEEEDDFEIKFEEDLQAVGCKDESEVEFGMDWRLEIKFDDDLFYSRFGCVCKT